MPDVTGRLQAALAERYTLERELDRGGMARVYLAEDRKHRRRVCLKVLHPELTYSLSAERFLREIEIAAGLQNPHILPIHDSGQAEGLLYYVMPYVEEGSLRERLDREKRLPIADAVRIAREVALALEHAHQHGVIHRDIKPENILLSAGEAVVADFGIARAVSEAGAKRVTQTGVAVGTPAYMSIEQASGDRDLDGRSDIYSLGCVLYELLTGDAPLEGSTPQETLGRRLSDTPTLPSEGREDIPEALDAIVLKALARLPEDRYPTAADLADAIASVERTVSETGVLLPHAKRPARRRRKIVVTGGIVVALAIVAALVAVLTRSAPGEELDHNLVAVLPFDVLDPDPELQFWHEGLMDVLWRRLDGAGPLRTVPASYIARHWTGRADRPSALSLAREAGAGLAVYGQLTSSGPDSVRVSATLLDTQANRPLGEIEELRGARERIADHLADSLAIGLLSTLRHSRPLTVDRIGYLGSSSPAAVRAFLRGEQYLRRLDYDSASVHYRRATELDTTFALGFSRLATALFWQVVDLSPAIAYELKAGELNHGLARRDSLLIVADSLWAAISSAQCSRLTTWPVAQRLLPTLNLAVRDYPLDPAAWYRLGDAGFHFPELGPTDQDSYDAFARAFELDSTYLLAHQHTVTLNLVLGSVEEARRVVTEQLIRGARGTAREALVLTDALLDPARTASPETDALMAAASTEVLWYAWLNVGWYPDSAESQVRIVRAIERQVNVPGWGEEALDFAGLVIPYTLAYRGHLREAARIPGIRTGVRGSEYNFVELAELGLFPPDSAAAAFQRWLGMPNARCSWAPYYAFRWWAVNGDTTSLRRALAFLDTLNVSDSDTAGVSYTRSAARAYLALARGDTLGALNRLSELPGWMRRAGTYREQLTLAQLLSARGRDAEAAGVLQRVPTMRIGLFLPGHVLWVLERARIHERLDNRQQALRDYKYVTDVWRHADPELQPFVDEAQRGLARLAEPG